MPRRIRVEYEGALYHVINRGNYRRDVFATAGAATAFETTLEEACERHGWLVHAYVVMRNHYHVALETPRPNLVDGMHWLQGTFATRFNRYRVEHGHLFQGRYRALLVEDAAILVRVINYIHLNPVRAMIVPAGQAAEYAWGSLRRLIKAPRPAWLVANALLPRLGWEDNAQGWGRYLTYLSELASDPAEQARQGFDELSKGWAIGTLGWKRAIARENSHLRLEAGLLREERRELKEAGWRTALQDALRAAGRTESDLVAEPKTAPWKIGLAAQLREQVAAPYSWLVVAMGLGHQATLRSSVWRLRDSQRATAFSEYARASEIFERE
jgi:REP element-mobilizing transposase RayT